MIELIKGNSADFTVNVTLDSTAYNISTHQIWFTVKDSVLDPDVNAHILVTSANQITITDAANGELMISLTPEDTDALPAGFTLECDVQIKTPEGKIYTILYDQITVKDRVTKAFTF